MYWLLSSPGKLFKAPAPKVSKDLKCERLSSCKCGMWEKTLGSTEEVQKKIEELINNSGKN